jgi:probable phosphoglycerate mutase
MSEKLPRIYLARHGETAWSLAGQHTSYTDVALTARGQEKARALGERLKAFSFVQVLTSPMQRARATCELAGLISTASLEPDLKEWNYGEYEGLKTDEILKQRPGWSLFRDGCPGGETPHQVGLRADRIISRLRAARGDVVIFSHGHLLRTLAARWLGLAVRAGQHFVLNAGSLSILGYEHERRDEPVVVLWNDDRHAPD